MPRLPLFCLSALLMLAPGAVTPALAQDALLPAPQVLSAPATTAIRQVVLTWSDATQAEQALAAGPFQAAVPQALADLAGLTLTPVKRLGTRSAVFRLNRSLNARQIRLLDARLSQKNGLLRIEPDVAVSSHALVTYDRSSKPSDPYFSAQWNLDASSASLRGGANFFGAWARQTSELPVTVGVIDTGYYPNDDLTGRETLGYDFVSSADQAGDGDGRDADPISPGDYCSGTLSAIGAWHGMQVAEQIAANASNGVGLIGAAWRNARLLQVRALGSCNGSLSDVADALRWTAGESIPGAPNSSTPVRVINLSLGGQVDGGCPAFMQDAVNVALARGIVVVASAGNDGLGTLSAPASCAGVISVGAHTYQGDLASYSNHQSTLTLTAPAGGDCKTLTSCRSNGLPAWNPVKGYSSMGGTSIAAPQVSATVAMMLAEAPSLTPERVAAILRQTAVAHPAGTYCASQPGECGAGMLNASAALAAVAQPTLLLSRTPSDASVPGGASLTLSASLVSASGSDNPALYRYAWTQTAGTPVSPSATDAPTLSFTTPARRSDGPLRWRVSATQIASGDVFTAETEIRLDNPPALQPASAPSGWGCAAGQLCSGQLSLSDADGDSVIAVQISGPEGAVAQDGSVRFTAGSTSPVTLQVVALSPDSGLRSAPLTLSIPVAGATSVAPTPASGGGGGGGSLDGLSLLAGLAACGALGLLRRTDRKDGQNDNRSKRFTSR